MVGYQYLTEKSVKYFTFLLVVNVKFYYICTQQTTRDMNTFHKRLREVRDYCKKWNLNIGSYKVGSMTTLYAETRTADRQDYEFIDPYCIQAHEGNVRLYFAI